MIYLLEKDNVSSTKGICTMKGFKLTCEPIIFLYAFIFAINYTSLPQLVLEKVCLQENRANQTECKHPEKLPDSLQKEATKWWFYLLTCSLVPSLLTIVIWGPVTDVIGRKKAMIFVPLMNGTRAIVYLINSYFLTAHPKYLLFGSFLSCFYGESQGVIVLCYAYMADVTVTDLNQRTVRMAVLEACLFAAGIPAGLLSGYLLQQTGYISVFILTLSVNVIMLLYVICFLPTPIKSPTYKRVSVTDSDFELTEKNADEQSHAHTRNLFNPFSYIEQVYKVIIKKDYRKMLLPLIFAFGFYEVGLSGEIIVETLYLKNKPFNFSYQSIGYYVAAKLGIRSIGVILITQVSFHCLHLSDYKLLIVGLLSQITCYILIGLSRSTIIVYLVNISGLAAAVFPTTIRSVATKYVSEENYGSILAVFETTSVIAAVIANCVSLGTYSLTLTVYSGVVYFTLAGLSLFSSSLVFLTLIMKKNCP